MQQSQSVIEEVKQKIDIVQFIGKYIQVKKSGRNYKAICPFHQEKSPSFYISQDRQIWHCFGACGVGGDVIAFFMKWENISFTEALKELAELSGVKFDTNEVLDKTLDKKQILYKINKLSADYYHFLLTKSDVGKEAMTYVKGRGTTEKIIETFYLGYAPQSWDSLYKFLKKKQISASDIFDAGLTVQNDNGSYYDRFRGRLMFPIMDQRGNISGFSGRLLEKDAKAVKYVNTPETIIYHKRESLYGIHLAKEAIRKEQNVLIVEGEFDMITPFQHGISNVVAIKGAAVTKEQLQVLKRYTQQITLALDADIAGAEAIRRGIAEAEKLEIATSVVTFDFAKDPDEAIKKDEIQFKKAIKNPISIYDFFISHAKRKFAGGSSIEKKGIGDEVIPYLSHITNPIVQSHYVRKLATILDVNEQSIYDILRKQLKSELLQSFKVKPSVEKQSTDDVIKREKYLMALVLQDDKPVEASRSVLEILIYEDFQIPALEKIAQRLAKFTGQYVQKEFFDDLPPELQPLANELFLYEIPETNMRNLIEKQVFLVKLDAIIRQSAFLNINRELSDDEKAEKMTILAKQRSEVEKKLKTL
ncbi:MAG: DNA primase [Candidatus Roizmanbacteria bacterium]